MGKELQKLGHKLSSDGTDNHLVLWDLRPLGLTGGKVEKVRRAGPHSSNSAQRAVRHVHEYCSLLELSKNLSGTQSISEDISKA